MKALGFDYIDLFLIHWPLPTKYDGDFVSTWRALAEFYREGRARSIGVSNFQPHQLRRLHAQSDIPPAANQIEVHPYLTQDELRRFCAEHQIAVEAWSPLARGGELLREPVIRRIAGETGKTPAQVVLRWHIQRGDIVFPKSVKNLRTGPDPDLFPG
jgi:2,5-diketo-D-gluconate reductase A